MVEERNEILEMYAEKTKLTSGVDLTVLAIKYGFSKDIGVVYHESKHWVRECKC